jgi:hypothetical protein
LINGLDPVNYGNMAGLRDYLVEMGVARTYLGQVYHAKCFVKDIRRIHREDPFARFVLIGFSLGANLVVEVARDVQPDGIQIDLMVFLSGNHPVAPMPKTRPANVCRVINLLADGLMGSRGERDWAENIRLTHTHHFGSPTHCLTLKTLAQEIAQIAATIPVVELCGGTLPGPVEKAPMPRPTRGPWPTTARGEWDFLKPVAQLKALSEGVH